MKPLQRMLPAIICVLLIPPCPALSQGVLSAPHGLHRHTAPALPAAPAQARADAGFARIPVSTELQEILDIQYLGAAEEFRHGLIAAVAWDDGAEWTGATGYSVREAGIRADADMLFNINLLTELMTTVLAYRLAEEGMLNLQDELLAVMSVPENVDENITIRQLIGHRSGLSCIVFDDASFYLDLIRDPGKMWSDEDLLAAIGPPRAPRGQEQRWSSTNTILLRMIIERATLLPYNVALRNYVLQPAGVLDVYVGGQDVLPGELLHRRMNIRHTLLKESDLSNLPQTAINSALCGVAGNYGTALAVARFFRALRAGDIISTDALQEIVSDGVLVPEGTYRQSDRCWWMHSSFHGCFIAGGIFPDDGVSLVIFSNAGSLGQWMENDPVSYPWVALTDRLLGYPQMPYDFSVRNVRAGDADGDGSCAPGERVRLGLGLEEYSNYWSTARSDVSLTLECSDPFVTITDGSARATVHGHSVTDIPDDAFAFTVSPLLEGSRDISLRLRITAENADIVDGSVLTIPLRIGHARSAMRFGSRGAMIAAPISETLHIGGQFTFESWVYINSVGEQKQGTIFSYGPSLRCYTAEGASARPDLRIELEQPGGTAQVSVLSDQYPFRKWFHLAVTYDGASDLVVYVDGERAESTVEQPLTGGLEDPFFMRVFAAGNVYNYDAPRYGFNGVLDDVRLWDIPRSADQVREFRMKSPDCMEQGLVLNWRLNDGLCSVATDCSGRGNNGEMYGVRAVEGVAGVVSIEDVPAPAWSMDVTPMPLRSSGIVLYTVPAEAKIRLAVYDMLGQEVATLVDDARVAPGSHRALFDANALAPGVYICTLRSGATVLTRRLAVIR